MGRDSLTGAINNKNVPAQNASVQELDCSKLVRLSAGHNFKQISNSVVVMAQGSLPDSSISMRIKKNADQSRIKGQLINKATQASNTTHANNAIHDFQKEPIAFAQNHVLNMEELGKSGAIPGKLSIKLLENSTPDLGYTVMPAKRGDPEAIEAYFLGFNGGGQGIDTPAYIDIPKKDVEGKMLFTGTLSGCSVIVTHLDRDHYRVYHDGRVNSSLLYDDVVTAVDFHDYYDKAASAKGETGIAATFIVF